MSPRARVVARAGAVLAAVLAVDQATKALVRADVERGSEDAILPFLDLVHTQNSGVAFGAFDGGGAIVVVLVAVALLALLAFFVTHLDQRLVWVPTGLLLGGALGNVVDRVVEGHVTDFLKLPAWPAFNVADIAITFGVLALLLVLESDGKERDADAAPGRA
ncbi:signal peptidase II [Conexibacter sp. SYSU D00693]|uniref:signal peptidase II n=1 Tax=Conexibacter sp. SYSU D00693 TaxID=2812560 RepID=UPI00196A7EC2|nr:signal peptidase II [Conexibacter sp. SYSU D00693]